MLLGRLLGRLQIRLPCVHRYTKVWICVRAPAVTRVEPHSVKPLRIFPLAKCVGVREDVAAVKALNHSKTTTYIARQPSMRRRMNILRPNAIADAKARRLARWSFRRPAETEHRFNIVAPQIELPDDLPLMPAVTAALSVPICLRNPGSLSHLKAVARSAARGAMDLHLSERVVC